jgi:HIV Tat-specific factor 1
LPDNTFIQYLQTYNTPTVSSTGQPQSQNKPLENTAYYINETFFKWDSTENKWVIMTDPVYLYIDYMTGVTFEWNDQTKQWTPKTQPQTNQVATSSSTTAASTTTTTEKKETNNLNNKKEKSWFEIDEDKNTNVYVSGLPLDIRDEEFEEMMQKYGIIMKDPLTSKLKLKLYRDENNEAKGDGRCCYLMPESVKLCLQLLDGSEYKNHKIKVERAKFEMKGGTYDPNKAATGQSEVKRKKLNKTKEKKLIEQQRQK